MIEVGILGTFLALDLVLFFVFFEVVLLPMYAVIAGWGGAGPAARGPQVRAVHAVRLGAAAGRRVRGGRRGRHRRPGGARPAAPALPRSTQLAAFVLLAVAFAVKSPLWPLHTWLPDAHTEAPDRRQRRSWPACC